MSGHHWFSPDRPGVRTVCAARVSVLGPRLAERSDPRATLPPPAHPTRTRALARPASRLTGVEIRYGVALGRDVTLAQLEAEYDAVILAAGTFRPNNLDLPGKDLRGIEHGMDFLLKVGQGQEVALGANVLVIGGGFSAMDCARTAAQLDANTVQLGEAPGGRGQIPALAPASMSAPTTPSACKRSACAR